MRKVLAALTACLALASCTTDQPPPGSGTAATKESQGRVDVDTPALRALKAEAGVEPCAPATGSASFPGAPGKLAASGLPRVTLPCLGGGPAIDLAKLRGPLVVNLFAQWCGPCRTELPYFQRLHRAAKGRVGVLGVDYLDTQPGQALQLVRRSRVTYPLLADPAGALRSDLRIRGLPGVVLLDADGKVADVEFRVFGSYRELRTFVEKGLKVTVPS